MELIDYAVLSLLVERPSYGYELYQRLESRFGGFMSTSQSNVYEVLNRLERDGYIARAAPGGSAGRPRSNRDVTEEGLEASRSYLAESLGNDPRRLELFARLASVGIRNIGEMERVLDRYEEQITREARQIGMPDPSPEVADPLGEMLWEMLVEQRRRTLAAQLEWIPYARELVRARMEGGRVGEDAG